MGLKSYIPSFYIVQEHSMAALKFLYYLVISYIVSIREQMQLDM